MTVRVLEEKHCPRKNTVRTRSSIGTLLIRNPSDFAARVEEIEPETITLRDPKPRTIDEP